MRQLRISQQAADTMRLGAPLAYIGDSRPANLGRVVFDVEDALYIKLEQSRLPGETFSDVIIRVNGHKTDHV